MSLESQMATIANVIFITARISMDHCIQRVDAYVDADNSLSSLLFEQIRRHFDGQGASGAKRALQMKSLDWNENSWINLARYVTVHVMDERCQSGTHLSANIEQMKYRNCINAPRQLCFN